MAKLIYSMLTSLDGYTEDEEVHSYINQLASPFGTYLYGRRMYETMVYWETAHTVCDQPRFVLDWARQWQGGENRKETSTFIFDSIGLPPSNAGSHFQD